MVYLRMGAILTTCKLYGLHLFERSLTKWPGMLHSLHLFSPKWLLGGGARLSRSSAKYLLQGLISLDNIGGFVIYLSLSLS